MNRTNILLLLLLVTIISVNYINSKKEEPNPLLDIDPRMEKYFSKDYQEKLKKERIKKMKEEGI